MSRALRWVWPRVPGHARVLWRAAPGEVALTFDDGPDPDGTPAVLEVLAENEARATFFLLTERARRAPALVTCIVDAGHEVALHADRHERLVGLPLADVTRRLADGRNALEDLAGRPVRFHRPPFGALSRPVLRAAGAAGMSVVMWSADPEDFVPRPAADASARLRAALRSRAVVLLHDGADTFARQGRATAAALRVSLPSLRGGLRTVVCSQL